MGALATLGFMRLRRWSVSYASTVINELESMAGAPPVQPNASDAVLSPMEINVKIIKEQLDTLPASASERIESLINDLAWTRLERELDGIYYHIFRSQVFFLRSLNLMTATAEIAMAEQFFNGLGVENPELRKITFQNWLGFLTSSRLVFSAPSGLSLTPLGQEFLVWLIRKRKPDKPHEQF